MEHIIGTLLMYVCSVADLQNAFVKYEFDAMANFLDC